MDLFAGGGGASEGIRQALGVGPAVAINHDAAAVAMHAANHPGTLHLCEDVFRVEPFRPRGQAIDLLWASPDCTHHSRAKGGKPRETGRRALANVVVEWARAVTPRVISLENVPEWLDWGPLDAEGHPVESRKGETFREWSAALKLAGYRIEHEILNAADYGTPTSRKRLFLVARCDGHRIRWPEPTHGSGALPWRTAGECIDWSIPMLSIFATREEAIAWRRAVGADGVPQRPLAEATQRRIAEGIRRYVLENPRPFLVQVNHGRDLNRSQDLAQPFPTVATGTGAHGFGLAVPFLANTRNGERDGQAPRVRSVNEPAPTVTGQGSQGALVAAFLAKHYGGVVGHELTRPLGTVTGVDHHSVVAAFLSKAYGNARHGHEFTPRPGAPLDAPAPTVTTVDHTGLVAAFLTKFYGTGGQWSGLDEPMHTIPTIDRMGLVTVRIDGEEYVITDIGFRMLQPRELARAQGFDDAYILTGNKREQVARIGNSVCPPVARAVVAAQFPDLARGRAVEAA